MRQQRFKLMRRLALCAILLSVAGSATPTSAWLSISGRARRPEPSAPIADEALPEAQVGRGVLAAIDATGEARVLVTLRVPAALDARGAERGLAVARAQAAVLAALSPADFRLYRQYTYVPGLAGTVTRDGLEALRRHPAVASIQPDERVSGSLAESVPALGADIVHSGYGLTGQGVTVAVLDSGVDTDHPDLSDDIVAQHCFTDGDCPPYDSDEGSSAEDENGHGTHVAGIVTARGAVSHAGFAPGASIVAVRVLAANNTGWVSDWIKGLDWVLAQRQTYNIKLVNMSLATYTLYRGNCDAEQPLAASAISQLVAAGVTIFAASGNQASPDSIGSPACNSGVIAVGATYDGNVGSQYWGACSQDDLTTSLYTITCFTNSNAALDLVAPGANIVAPYVGGGTMSMAGTSMASPTAAGIAALMLEANPDLTPATIEAILEATGTPVTDRKNGLRFPLVNALRAVASAAAAPGAVTIQGASAGAILSGYTFTATVRPPTAAQPISYTWEATAQPPVTSTGGLTNSATFRWSTPGTQTITVTAANAYGSASATHPIVIDFPDGVTIDGPAFGAIDTGYSFVATVRPVTITRPVTYRWEATGQSPITHTSGLTDAVTFTWSLPGTQTIAVTAASPDGIFTDTHRLFVGENLFLPVILRPRP